MSLTKVIIGAVERPIASFFTVVAKNPNFSLQQRIKAARNNLISPSLCALDNLTNQNLIDSLIKEFAERDLLGAVEFAVQEVQGDVTTDLRTRSALPYDQEAFGEYKSQMEKFALDHTDDVLNSMNAQNASQIQGILNQMKSTDKGFRFADIQNYLTRAAEMRVALPRQHVI